MLSTTPIIEGNVIAHNNCPSGGGVYSHRADATFRSNEIFGNTGVDGAGLYLEYATPYFEDNIIKENSRFGAPGIFVMGYSDPIFIGGITEDEIKKEN